MSNPLQDQLNAISGQAQGAAVQTAQPIEQAQNVQQAQALHHAPAVAQNYAPAPVAAAPLTMDSNEVAASGSVSAFIKLRDGVWN